MNTPNKTPIKTTSDSQQSFEQITRMLAEFEDFVRSIHHEYAKISNLQSFGKYVTDALTNYYIPSLLNPLVGEQVFQLAWEQIKSIQIPGKKKYQIRVSEITQYVKNHTDQSILGKYREKLNNVILRDDNIKFRNDHARHVQQMCACFLLTYIEGNIYPEKINAFQKSLEKFLKIETKKKPQVSRSSKKSASGKKGRGPSRKGSSKFTDIELQIDADIHIDEESKCVYESQFDLQETKPKRSNQAFTVNGAQPMSDMIIPEEETIDEDNEDDDEQEEQEDDQEEQETNSFRSKVNTASQVNASEEISLSTNHSNGSGMNSGLHHDMLRQSNFADCFIEQNPCINFQNDEIITNDDDPYFQIPDPVDREIDSMGWFDQ